MSELESSNREVHFSIEGYLFGFNTEELCEASEYFQAMLNGNFRESQENAIVLQEIDVKMFSIFHEWMTVKDKDFSLQDLETDELLQLIHLVDRFFVQKLMHICNLEVVKRLENKAELFNKYRWKHHLYKSEAVNIYCQFIEFAVTLANAELKELCVNWLFSQCFKITPKDTIERLEIIKRQMTNLTEVELIRDISAALSETASAEFMKMLSGLAEKELQTFEEQIKLKKIQYQEGFSDALEFVRRLRQQRQLANIVQQD